MKGFVNGLMKACAKACVKRVGCVVLLVPAMLAAQDARPIALDEAVQLARRNAPATVRE